MLSSFRSFSQNNIAKAIMILVLLTFALWGVGDVIRSGNKMAVIKVGSFEISDAEWNKKFKQFIARMEGQFNKKISKEEIQQNDIIANFGRQLTDQLLIKAEAQRMGIDVSDEMVKYRISRIPQFQKDGKFDKEQLAAFLKNAHVTEAELVESIKDSTLFELIVNPFSFLRAMPESYIEQVVKSRSIVHAADIYSVSLNSIALDKSPSEEEIMGKYEQYKDKFSNAEKRDIAYFTFSLKDVKAAEAPTEKELQEVYESRKNLFNEPEKRDVDQMMFADEAKAKEAKAMLDKGSKFTEVGKKFFPDKASLSVGMIGKNGLDKNMSEAIFGAEKGAYSAVVKSPMGYHIFLIKSIVAAKEKTFADVKEQLAKEYAEEKKFEALSSMAQDINSLSSANSTIEEIAAKFGFKVETVNGVTVESKDGLLSNASFKNAAFSTPDKTVSMVSPLAGETDRLFVVEVKNIVPQGFKEFNVVKNDVVALWQNDERAKVATKLLFDLKDKAGNKADMASYMSTHKITAENTQNFDLKEGNKKYPLYLAKELRILNVGQLTNAVISNDGKAMIIAQLAKVSLDDNVVKNAKGEMVYELASALRNEYMQEFLLSLREQYKAEFNLELATEIAMR